MSDSEIAETTEVSMTTELPTNPTPVEPVQTRGSAIGWVIWGVSASFLLFQFFLQLTSGEIVAGLMKSFSLTAFGGGVLASAYYYVYVTLQTPAGLLIDRFGPRKLLALGALVCGLGCFVFSHSSTVWVACFGRLAMGFGAAFAFVGSLKLISNWFPPTRFAIMVGIAETVGMMGSVVGSFFLAEYIRHHGWRESMFIAAIVGVVIAVLIAVIVRDAPRRAPPVFKHPKALLWRELRLLLKNKYAWINGLYSGLMFAVSTVFVALWSIPYLMLSHHVSLSEADLAANMVFLGIAIGSPFLGWIDAKDKFCNRRTLFVVCAFACTILLSIVIYVTSLPMWLVFMLMVVLGLFMSCYVLTFAVANELVPENMRGTSMGFLNTLAVGTAPILQPFVGFILTMRATGVGIDGAPYYSVYDYQIALSILPVLLIVAMWLGRYIPKRY